MIITQNIERGTQGVFGSPVPLRNPISPIQAAPRQVESDFLLCLGSLGLLKKAELRCCLVACVS
jgi:hypothetical protein